ncbi:hypothetical protein F5Y16DRAFT_369862 [Xylariaceae sp. FL0255]|nr:hypothetical protein F5Y16DRAFT_369862 [Xylariaceae sp. FL0255]
MASRMLTTALRPTASRIAATRAAVIPRSFTGSATCLKHKESGDESHDPEKHKQDLLSKHKDGKGHWKPELASDSEEAIKADRAHEGKENIADLQKRTQATAEETAKKGTSMHDGL